MPYLIWKVETRTGVALRPMPVLFSSLNQASVEAACLNEKFQSPTNGCFYVAKEAHDEAIQTIDFEHNKDLPHVYL